MFIFRAVNYAPLFSATLCDVMASHDLTQVRAAEISGLGRNILVRLASGDQWPHAEHLAGVVKLAATPDERARLIDALASDCAAAAGLDRFIVSESDKSGVVLMKVPGDLAGLIEDAILLAKCNPTGAIALKGVVESLLPGVVYTEALRLDSESLRSPPRKARKNRGAPSARPDFPQQSKAN